MKKLTIILLSLLIITACKNKHTSIINGQFFGAANKSIELEQLSPNGGVIVDTTVTNSDGKFSFKIDLSGREEPTFYNIRYENQFVPLLIDKGEKIDLNSVGNIYINYKVSGSKGSELLNQFNKQTIETSLKLDSLGKLISNSAYNDEQRIELGRQRSKEYIKLKQQAINFVMHNSNSLVSIIPFYQPIYNGRMLFDVFEDPNDIIYFRAIADSLENRYPKSAYVKALRNDIKRVDNSYLLDSMLNATINTSIQFPEIEMKDATGKPQKLSSLLGKTILLNFTSSSQTALKVLNRELADVYEKYKGENFEIFEVSIELNKAAWIKSITDNRLPWIQVCDFLGEHSPALSSYNVQSLPANFLINAQGEIINKNLNNKQLDETLAKILN